jgi:hypothetical protein
VIGSQSVLASFNEDQLPPEAVRSIEADLAFLDDPDEAKLDQIDGAIGEVSKFEETFGIYGHGVSLDTAVLPAGWRDRLVPFTDPESGVSEAVCLEPHDLIVSKLVAGRDKDFPFATAVLRAGLVDVDTLRARVDLLPSLPPIKRRITSWLEKF